jgi:hypothetical protein
MRERRLAQEAARKEREEAAKAAAAAARAEAHHKLMMERKAKYVSSCLHSGMHILQRAVAATLPVRELATLPEQQCVAYCTWRCRTCYCEHCLCHMCRALP